MGIAVFSAGTALTVLSAGFADMLIYRAATGVGEAMQLTVLLAIAVNYHARSRGAAVIGFLLFHGSPLFAMQSRLSLMWGIVVSGILDVNLAGYQLKAVHASLASRGSGIFVTSLYASAVLAGYSMGWLAGRAGWVTAGFYTLSLTRNEPAYFIFVMLSLICVGLRVALHAFPQFVEIS